MRANQDGPADRRRLPSVRLAPRDELAGMARVAPLLRAARDLGQWAAQQRPDPGLGFEQELAPAAVVAAASALDLAPREVGSAWQVMIAATQLASEGLL